MNYLGKIFVFAVFIMSLVLMTLAGGVFLQHNNWRDAIYRKPEQCTGNQQPGWEYQLDEAKKKKQALDAEIEKLTTSIATAEQARDQVVAKLQSALSEKSKELDDLRKNKDEYEQKRRENIAELGRAQEALKEATALVEKLREDVRAQQVKVDERVETAAKLAAALEESKAQLAVADERRQQLEKQVANARILLRQNGLALDSPPKDLVPTLDGQVTAVAADAIELSLGADDGLQVGHVVEVYRSGEYVGRAVIRRVQPDRAVAELDQRFARGIVQRGDSFTTQLKGRRDAAHG